MTYRGKKIGTLTVRLKYRDGHKHDRPHLDIDLRFDTGRGDFHAEYGGNWYTSKTQLDLEQQIAKVADKDVSMVWKRYIEVDYKMETMQANGRGDAHYQGQSGSFTIGKDRSTQELLGDPEDREPDHQVPIGIHLRWDVVDITEPYEVPEKPGMLVRSSREVDGEGESEYLGKPTEHKDDKLRCGLMLWTPEREAALRTIRDALGKLDENLNALFVGSVDQLGAKVQAIALGALRGQVDSIGFTLMPKSGDPDAITTRSGPRRRDDKRKDAILAGKARKR